ncbi:MAG: UDP-N-acetylmuramoyl-tripeptide--D-alanyl-D-alanine ligase [Flavobacteriales bacterium]|nr:UDP-N-acetylmuramoyl-tripeptide--D-alanyl-D-alanine ligase [Flavobacteriales bacterium]
MNTLYQLFLDSSGICTDTRKIQSDCIFVCIKGENFDGNTFAAKALESGAKHVIVDNETYFTDTSGMTLVENSVKWLQELANHHRKQFDIPVIGITGSNGKTSTKELIHAVLSQKYNVLATIGNLNNHLGVPFTLLRMKPEHEIAIIEMGANRFKDIEELSIIAEPTHGIITNIGKAHLEGFGGFEGVLRTKRELYESIESSNGLIVYNADDEILKNALPKEVKTVNYGTENGDIRGELVDLSPFVEMKWMYESYTSPVLKTQMIGKYNFYNYLAAVTFGIVFDVPATDISAAIEEYTPTNNRSQVKKTEKNTLILDCYNANPTSMRSALESFAANSHPDKLFIIGDMKELGKEEEKEHKAIVELIEKLNLQGYTVGDAFKQHASSSILQQFETTQELNEFLSSENLSGKLILLKGSRSIGLEKAEEFL